MFHVTNSIQIPQSAITIVATRASGPGGQHVNKTSSAVHLFLDTGILPRDVRQRLASQHPGRVDDAGILHLRAERHRSQWRNREDGFRRLVALIAGAARAPRNRLPIELPLSAAERRLQGKRRRAEVKQLRRKVERWE